jgi:hypothetical protein
VWQYSRKGFRANSQTCINLNLLTSRVKDSMAELEIFSGHFSSAGDVVESEMSFGSQTFATLFGTPLTPTEGGCQYCSARLLRVAYWDKFGASMVTQPVLP